jgi:hypothetical protein
MDERADAFAVLPGGIGTLEELMEIITLRHLGYHDRPVVLVDPGGYWDPLLVLFARMVDEGTAAASISDLFAVATDAEEAIALLELEASRVAAGEPQHLEAGGR